MGGFGPGTVVYRPLIENNLSLENTSGLNDVDQIWRVLLLAQANVYIWQHSWMMISGF